MAFSKQAKGHLVHRNFSPENWGNFIGENRSRLVQGSTKVASGSTNLVAQASEILKDEFSPDKYLLSHATIVASVDTENALNVKLGNFTENGQSINRRWSNYRVTPETEHFINNNLDSWDRPVILKSYRTFVGAHSFVEHVQIEEQSKGRIIDAVARDIGPSIYVDILIANDRKHTELINDIESGRLNTLSMGCSVTHTVCTKCGNVAPDETALCSHIKYEKGNVFFDERGVRRKIAELCGHEELNPTGGVTFIEASWVAVPAFQGAVMRNILTPDIITVNTQNKLQEVLSQPPKEWATPSDQIAKAARWDAQVEQRRQTRIAQLPPMPMPGEEGPPGEGGGEDKDPMDELTDKVEKYVLNEVQKRLKKKLLKDDEKDGSSDEELATSTNENINHQATVTKLASGTEALLRVARSDVELLDGVARLEQSHGLKVSRDLYRTALRVGSTDGHPSLEKYLSHCAEVLGHQPTTGEAKTLVRLGRILSLRKKTRF